jgi:hypothetical protein
MLKNKYEELNRRLDRLEYYFESLFNEADKDDKSSKEDKSTVKLSKEFKAKCSDLAEKIKNARDVLAPKIENDLNEYAKNFANVKTKKSLFGKVKNQKEVDDAKSIVKTINGISVFLLDNVKSYLYGYDKYAKNLADADSYADYNKKDGFKYMLNHIGKLLELKNKILEISTKYKKQCEKDVTDDYIIKVRNPLIKELKDINQDITELTETNDYKKLKKLKDDSEEHDRKERERLDKEDGEYKWRDLPNKADPSKSNQYTSLAGKKFDPLYKNKPSYHSQWKAERPELDKFIDPSHMS